VFFFHIKNICILFNLPFIWPVLQRTHSTTAPPCDSATLMKDIGIDVRCTETRCEVIIWDTVERATDQCGRYMEFAWRDPKLTYATDALTAPSKLLRWPCTNREWWPPGFAETAPPRILNGSGDSLFHFDACSSGKIIKHQFISLSLCLSESGLADLFEPHWSALTVSVWVGTDFHSLWNTIQDRWAFSEWVLIHTRQTFASC